MPFEEIVTATGTSMNRVKKAMNKAVCLMMKKLQARNISLASLIKD
jgi:hypothetical protein